MASTRNLMSSVLFSLPYVNYQPLNVSNAQPALDAANITKQTILGAPFAWPWNRGDFSIDVSSKDPVTGQPMIPSQDYLVDMPRYGHLEKVWLTDASGKVVEIKIVLALAQESAVQRPSSCAALTVDDEDGTVVLRLNTIPDQSYTLAGIYQYAAGQMTSLATSWSPLPDHLSYIYDFGFLFWAAMLVGDGRAGYYGQKFVAHLLGAQEGLTATQRNIFLTNFLDLIREPLSASATTQQGISARQV